MKAQSGSKYQKVLLAAQRAKQLQNGATPRVKAAGAKPSKIALSEIEQGLLQMKGGEEQEEILCSVPPAQERTKPTVKGKGKTGAKRG